jgi:hypothetical protein
MGPGELINYIDTDRVCIMQSGSEREGFTSVHEARKACALRFW